MPHPITPGLQANDGRRKDLDADERARFLEAPDSAAPEVAHALLGVRASRLLDS